MFFCGMGGSGISGEILAALYPEVEIISVKDYVPPRFVGRETLAILISYSGNTEETLANYAALSKRGVPLGIISSDGELFRKNALFKIRVPAGLPPRGALGYLFAGLPMALYGAGLIKKNPRSGMERLVKFLRREIRGIEARARRLSRGLVGRLPVIYANSAAFGVVANRWRCQLNENAKILCHTNVIPEMNHNEIVGLGRPAGLSRRTTTIVLSDPAAHDRNKIRTRILMEIIKREAGKPVEIIPAGGNAVERMFWTIMLGDFLSYYLAVRTGIDPLPVKRIDYLKKRLAAE